MAACFTGLFTPCVYRNWGSSFLLYLNLEFRVTVMFLYFVMPFVMPFFLIPSLVCLHFSRIMSFLRKAWDWIVFLSLWAADTFIFTYQVPVQQYITTMHEYDKYCGYDIYWKVETRQLSAFVA